MLLLIERGNVREIVVEIETIDVIVLHRGLSLALALGRLPIVEEEDLAHPLPPDLVLSPLPLRTAVILDIVSVVALLAPVAAEAEVTRHDQDLAPPSHPALLIDPGDRDLVIRIDHEEVHRVTAQRGEIVSEVVEMRVKQRRRKIKTIATRSNVA